MTTTIPFAEVASTYQRKPAYRYIRKSDRMPTIAEARAEATPIARIRLFNPTGIGTWWLAGYDPPTTDALDPAYAAEMAAHGFDVTTSGVAWGIAEVHEREMGDIWIPELVAFRGRMGLPIERDLYFTPCPLTEAR